MKPEEQLQAQIQTASVPTSVVRDQDKIMLVLSYLGVLALIPLLSVKDSDFVRWHAMNGLTLAIAGLLIIVVMNFLLPVVGCFLWPLETIAFIGLTVLAIAKALRGERWRIPVVTDIAEKF
jgi:uncharacterized membrane protein